MNLEDIDLEKLFNGFSKSVEKPPNGLQAFTYIDWLEYCDTQHLTEPYSLQAHRIFTLYKELDLIEKVGNSMFYIVSQHPTE